MFKYLKLLIILYMTIRCHGRNYVMLLDKNGIFKPCDASENAGNVNMEDLFQINLNNEYADDMETLITNGNITIAVDIRGDALLKMKLEVFKWTRGKWEKTLYSMRRDDFCSALFDSTEMWYSLAKSIPEKDRTCPPKKDTVYHFNNMENRVELQNVNALHIEGQYKIIAQIISDRYSTCITAVVDVWKN